MHQQELRKEILLILNGQISWIQVHNNVHYCKFCKHDPILSSDAYLVPWVLITYPVIFPPSQQPGITTYRSIYVTMSPPLGREAVNSDAVCTSINMTICPELSVFHVQHKYVQALKMESAILSCQYWTLGVLFKANEARTVKIVALREQGKFDRYKFERYQAYMPFISNGHFGLHSI